MLIGCGLWPKKMGINMLKGKNCLITGATGGIGSCIARRLAEEGCNLFLTSAHRDKLTLLCRELLTTGYEGKLHAVKCDLNNTADIDTMADYALKCLSIDILINCAGVYIIDPIEGLSLDDYETTMNVNMRAAFLLSKAFVPNMIEQQWGRIVNIASVAAYSGYKNNSIYCASKHALLGFSRSLHEELKEHNIRVFCISPGATKTPMGGKDQREDSDTFIKLEEIAKYIAQVISFDSTMVSEEVILNRMVIP